MFAVMGLPLFAQVDNAVSLTIRFTDGKTQFHAGEVIPVELTFSASVPDTYDLNTRNYDRSGRLNAEAFHVTPPGRDPLRNYYANGLFMFGGLCGNAIELPGVRCTVSGSCMAATGADLGGPGARQ
jgi:hypothetical protein